MLSDFQYYNQQEADLFAFYQIPKELTTNKNYKHISNDAKFLYGLLRDRNQLSIKNNWIDKDGNVYIIFTRDEAMEILNVAKEKISKIFKELLCVNLIKEVRQGLNKPNIIYVGKIIVESVHKSLRSENRTSGGLEFELQEIRKSNASNTYIINTDFSNINMLVSQLNTKENLQNNELTNIFIQCKIDTYEDITIQNTLKGIITALYNDIETRDTIKHINVYHIDEATKLLNKAIQEKEIKNPLKYLTKCIISAIKEGGFKGLNEVAL